MEIFHPDIRTAVLFPDRKHLPADVHGIGVFLCGQTQRAESVQDRIHLSVTSLGVT